jgi:predicted acylesterase/phospholipase RssA
VVRLAPGAGDAIARQLGEALSGFLECVVLDGHEVPEPGRGEEPAAVYGSLLDLAEASHDLVLLDGGVLGSGRQWGEFCLQQADRLLAIVGDGQPRGDVALRPELRGCDLIALDVVPGGGTIDGWGELLDPIECHAVRTPSADEDIARLARRLSGRSVGIVLSGGGARAFAHIGVLEELTAAGITIDRVAGVSMGAFVGALFAMGLGADEMDAVCFEEWVQRRPLSDYTVPRHSLIRGERFRSMLQRTFGNATIEELPLGFMCGCTELRSGRLVLARHGPLWEAVGFSICLPVIAPPQVRGREIFIDGSLVDNLPVRALAELGEGPVIAVDVKASFERPRVAAPSEPVRNGPGSHRWRSADGSHGGLRRSHQDQPPSIGETLTRVLLLGSANTTEQASRHADMVIKPSAPGVGLLEFHQLDAARNAGREAAREALEGGAAVGIT